MIIGEGIVSVQSLIATSASSVEEIALPSSLKVIQNCFNNLNKLKSVTIPEGVEVIIGSFWANTYASHNGYGQYNKGEEYPFDIAIPDSVKIFPWCRTILRSATARQTPERAISTKKATIFIK